MYNFKFRQMISIVFLQMGFPIAQTFILLLYVLFFVVAIFTVYLLIRFLVAGRQFFEVLTAYFRQKTENERGNLDQYRE